MTVIKRITQFKQAYASHIEDIIVAFVPARRTKKGDTGQVPTGEEVEEGVVVTPTGLTWDEDRLAMTLTTTELPRVYARAQRLAELSEDGDKFGAIVIFVHHSPHRVGLVVGFEGCEIARVAGTIAATQGGVVSESDLGVIHEGCEVWVGERHGKLSAQLGIEDWRLAAEEMAREAAAAQAASEAAGSAQGRMDPRSLEAAEYIRSRAEDNARNPQM